MIQMLVILSIVSKIQGCRKLFYGKRDGRVGGGEWKMPATMIDQGQKSTKNTG